MNLAPETQEEPSIEEETTSDDQVDEDNTVAHKTSSMFWCFTFPSILQDKKLT